MFWSFWYFTKAQGTILDLNGHPYELLHQSCKKLQAWQAYLRNQDEGIEEPWKRNSLAKKKMIDKVTLKSSLNDKTSIFQAQWGFLSEIIMMKQHQCCKLSLRVSIYLRWSQCCRLDEIASMKKTGCQTPNNVAYIW